MLSLHAVIWGDVLGWGYRLFLFGLKHWKK